MSKRPSSAAAALLPLLLLGACATVPVEQVRVYTDAFDEARAAGHRLYDEVGPIIAQSEAPAPPAQPEGPQPAAFVPAATVAAGENGVCPEPSAPTPYPPCFEPSEFLPGAVPGEPKSVAARRRALDTIATYNAVALRLASGESAEAVGAEVRRLSSNVSALATLTGAGAAALPIAGFAGDLAAELAAWAETLRTEQQLRQAIAAGAPIVHALIDALIADTARLYAFKRTEVAKQLTTLKADAQRASLAAKATASRHARPEGTLQDQLMQLDRRFIGARERFDGLPFLSLTALGGTGGSEPFGDGTIRELGGATAQIEALAGEYGHAVQGLVRYHAALGEYVRTLHGADEALDEVTAALAAPRTVTVNPVVLVARAVEVRDRAQQVRRALDEL